MMMSQNPTASGVSKSPAVARTWLEFPQPPSSSSSSVPDTYRYIRAEEISEMFFPDKNNNFVPNTTVWVCRSRGLKRGSRQTTPIVDAERETATNTTKKGDGTDQRFELYMRARVLGPDGDRIRVQYPKGSTYGCHPCHLRPVLEHVHHLVLVTPETPYYRRCCMIHTLPDESFLEIGCDFAITTDKVYQTGSKNRLVWGLDKSEESIRIARQRYPHLALIQWDVLETQSWPNELHDAQPSVIAVDINGNRELEAVQQCLKRLFQQFRPRLVIVKSRALHQQVPSCISNYPQIP